ncbi:hypothetical protein AAFC00_004582 [Neodothiora populina]|uniref:WD40 repeat-like protein n=1 Tax=Neodothiora populina TaxID=2781224 RepID=A0ABR3P2H4_9PEZI
MASDGDIPQLHGTFRLFDSSWEKKRIDCPVFDVKFYPYDVPDADPIFAVVESGDVFVLRPDSQGDTTFHTLKHIRDPNENLILNSLAWAQDISTGDPLLCVAGSGSKSIKVFNPLTGTLVKVINGHGGDINDLAVSPRSSTLLASGSADYSIRLWTLNPRHQKQPCAAILGGGGHTQPILTLGFHSSGKYLISGGEDTMVCLWAVPDLSDEEMGTDVIKECHYPLFASSEIHSDYVDCIEFFGDLILSRACGGSPVKKPTKSPDDFKRNDIILWKIDGFPHTDASSPEPPIPEPGVHTRSAFGGRFQLLLTFELWPATPFYMRFGLFNQPHHRPMLAMGDELSKYSFWDLQHLLDTYELDNDTTDTQGTTSDSEDDDESATKPLTVLSDPLKPIPAHKLIHIPGSLNFACRQVAWSYCGKWCIAVGDYGMIVAFKRWS